MMCALHHGPITGLIRLLYMRPLRANAELTTKPETVCLPCYLRLSPTEYRARVALGLPVNA